MNNTYDSYLCRDTIISKGAVAYGSDGSMSVASPIYQDKYGRLYFYEDGEKWYLDECTKMHKYSAANIEPVKYEVSESMWQRFKNIFYLPY